MNDNPMKVIVWSHEIDDLYLNKGLIGGLAIQMRHWAETFVRKEWEVYAPTYNKSREHNGIKFFRCYKLSIIGTIVEYILAFYYLLSIKPDLILLRGARRQLGGVAFFAKLFKIKLVFFGASDADFKPEEELISKKISRIIYRKGLKNTDYFVLQNDAQKELLQKNYGDKKNIIIPNIWTLNNDKQNESERYIDFLWVGNFRELKRPDWFIRLAEENSDYTFVMVGGGIDGDLFGKCKERASKCENLKFLGRMNFDDVNKLFEHTKIYICTSSIEGFPNTFLQSWSNQIPVITTFDPSNVIKSNDLGICVDNYDELKNTTRTLIENTSMQEEIKENIAKYFTLSHDADTMYEKIIDMLK